MFTTVRRRKILLAALLGAMLAALGFTVASSRAEPGRTHGDGSECCVAPTADGKLIAFDGYFPAVAPDGAQGIYLTDQNGGSYSDFRRLTVSPAGGFDTGPNISPDGRKLAFRRVLSDSGP